MSDLEKIDDTIKRVLIAQDLASQKGEPIPYEDKLSLLREARSKAATK